MKVYFISGLGADKRVFKHISLPDRFEVIYLEWMAPEINESIEGYAVRLSEKINTNVPFSLVGLSMGGMIASEISKRYKPRLTILISSVPLSSDLPPYYKWIASINLGRLIPVRLMKSAFIVRRLFATETNDDKSTLIQMIRDTDMKFTKWAMSAIPKWKNKELPLPYIHIHGTSDKVLPVRYTKPTHVIEKGGHLIVMNRANEINRILEKAFSHIK
ncbi:MAG TPA: alpha/beta hydrolase [Puia sp.]|nr:alpha/beta hydrolase [Puia sp.]